MAMIKSNLKMYTRTAAKPGSTFEMWKDLKELEDFEIWKGLEELEDLEEAANEAVAIINANRATLGSIVDRYERVNSCSEYNQYFAEKMHGMRQELEMHSSSAELLCRTISNRKKMVSL